MNADAVRRRLRQRADELGLEFLGRIENTPGAVRAAVLECLSADVPGDGAQFSDEIDVMQAMVDDRYPGLRVKLRGDLAGARFTLRLDIGVDDVVVPAPGWVDYPPLSSTVSPPFEAPSHP